MTITLKPHSTVLFAGDSITTLWRPEGEARCGYPLLVAGEWCFRHPERPIVSILVGVNDNGRHTFDPRAPEVSADEFAAGYDRLLAPLADAGTKLILIEPFLLPVEGVTEAGDIRIDDDVRRDWRAGLDPKIEAVRHLASEYGAHLLAADRMFAGLSAETGPERWSNDGVHPTPAGHAALAEAWLRLVA